MVRSEMLVRSDPLLKSTGAINIPENKELVWLTNIFIYYSKMATKLTHYLETFYIKNQPNCSRAIFLKMKCDPDDRWNANKVEETMNSGKCSKWSERDFA
jgi:hypothetical protein